MAIVYIDGKSYEVDPAQNMLEAAQSLRLNLPYFCWHPALGSVGACRQCAVKQFRDEKDTRGKLVMACLTPAVDGTRISIQDPEAVTFRASVIEWLMVNHPHDCPVCDEGGECHLQDMTLMTGHVYRRYHFTKRTYRNQYLGPLVNHEMNRCIQCYRCVRFYRDYAGGRDFDVFASHDDVYFGRQTDGILENEFSGNLVEVCPTGVFTDKTLKEHYTRKWDLQTAPSICVHCGLGCNTIPGERYGELRRIRNRYHEDVNRYFLCDRGRYGYDFVNSASRIRQPRLKTTREAASLTVSHADALRSLVEPLRSGSTLIGIGSPRASLESNFALLSLVGPDNFYAGISPQEATLDQAVLNILQNGPVPSASLRDAEMSDAVLVLGEDLTNTAPVAALAIRQSAHQQPWAAVEQQKKIDAWNDSPLREASEGQTGALYIASPYATKLDDAATQVVRLAPDDIARLGFAVAGVLDSNGPDVPDLSEEVKSLATEIADKLRGAQRPLVVAGTSLGSVDMLHAAANLAWALRAAGRDAKILLTVPECNSLGLAMLTQNNLEQALQSVKESQNPILLMLENDLYHRADRKLVDALLQTSSRVVAMDSVENRTTAQADLVLPVGTFAESDGTLVNNEGRAQRYFQVMVPDQEIQESWCWILELTDMARPQTRASWRRFDDLVQGLSKLSPAFSGLTRVAPPADFRMVDQKIPRQPHRYSGRTAMHANIDVNEPKPPDDPDSPLAFSMEGYPGQPPAALIPRYWEPGWNSVQALNRFQSEVGGPLRGGDPGKRLIEADSGKAIVYYRDVPGAFRASDGKQLVLPLYRIFGSEELSRIAPAISELVPAAYLAINSKLAESMHLESDGKARIRINDIDVSLPVRVDSSLPAGVVGLPAGWPDLPVGLPAWGEVAVAE